jgi:transcriptional regulator with XRE-family HTH domain
MSYENALSALGSRIKAARRKHSLSQEELASRLNVSSITVSRWERGKQSPDYITLCQIAEIFDIPLSFLTELEGEESSRDDIIILISGRTKKKSSIASGFDFILRDIGRLNPDALISIHEAEQAWDGLSDNEKRTLADGLSFVFGSFSAAISGKKNVQNALGHSTRKTRQTED